MFCVHIDFLPLAYLCKTIACKQALYACRCKVYGTSLLHITCLLVFNNGCAIYFTLAIACTCLAAIVLSILVGNVRFSESKWVWCARCRENNRAVWPVAHELVTTQIGAWMRIVILCVYSHWGWWISVNVENSAIAEWVNSDSNS